MRSAKLSQRSFAISEVNTVPPERARALVCAAIRETFEESGVLLAGSAASGTGLVGEERKQQTEFAGGAGEIVLAEQLRQLLLKVPVNIDTFGVGANQPVHDRRSDRTEH